MKTNHISNELLLISVTNFYKNNKACLTDVLPIIFKTSTISLRLIDWFVTNYCKKYNVIFTRKQSDCSMSSYFNVYSNYRSQLKAFKKIKFDPFRRRERIKFFYTPTDYVETTIGQLNFFRWFVENGLLAYVTEHYNDIEKDMNLNQKEEEMLRNNTNNTSVSECDTNSLDESPCSVKRRKHLSKSMLKKMTKFSGNAVITFN